MAINYLNSINLNQNELLQGVVENQPNDAAAGSSPVEGQLYFNTTAHVLKQYTGTAWAEVGGGVITLTLNDGTYIDVNSSGTAANPIFAPDLSAADGTASAASRFLTKDNTWATVPQGDITALTEGTYIGIVNPNGPIPTINHDLTTRTDTTSTDAPGYGSTFEAVTSVTTNTTGHVTAIDVSTVTIPASDDTTYDLTTAPTGTAIRLTDGTGSDDVTISGTTSEVAVTRISATELRAGLTADVTISNDLTVSNNLEVDGDATFNGGVFDITGGAVIDFGANKITNVADPTAAQDAATKQYVDDSVAGGLIYQGGYNAATNTPNLDSNPSPNPIKQGWTYTVTADGLFFTEQVRVGDVLIAEQDAPTALADWTTAQNNVDLADLTTVGLGNVNAGEAIDVSYSNGTATVSVENSTASNKGAVIVAPGGAIDVSYTSGTATVSVEDSTASNKGAVIVAGGTGVSVAYLNGTATVTNTATNSSNTFAYTIPSGAQSSSNIHTLNTRDVIVQLYDTVTYETVYAEVDRIATNQITVRFGAQITNAIRVLVQKIG